MRCQKSEKDNDDKGAPLRYGLSLEAAANFSNFCGDEQTERQSYASETMF